MKKIIFICCIVFALTACSGNKPNEPINGNANGNDEIQVTETKKETEHGNDESTDTVPKNLPIYPDSNMTLTLPSFTGENIRTWWFDSPASGNEIVEFYITELKNLGLEIDEDYTYVDDATFEVHTVNEVVTVINDESQTFSSEVNPDTPGRNYIIAVNLDKWNDE